MSEQRKSPPNKRRSGKSTQKPRGQQHRKHSVQFIVWAMNGGPLPESVIKKLDDAMQQVMDETQEKVRLAATTVRV